MICFSSIPCVGLLGLVMGWVG